MNCWTIWQRGVFRRSTCGPPSSRRRAEGKVYHMHDTHWTAFGAVTAFNAIVEADSHPDWKLDPARVLGAPETFVGGDLARLLGTADDVKETDRLLTLPSGKREPLDDRKQFATALSHKRPLWTHDHDHR